MCNNTNNLQHCKLQLPVSQRSSRSLTEVEIAPMPKSLLLAELWRSKPNEEFRTFRLSRHSQDWDTTTLIKAGEKVQNQPRLSSKKCILEGLLMTIF